jgi:hypothetical protein
LSHLVTTVGLWLIYQLYLQSTAHSPWNKLIKGKESIGDKAVVACFRSPQHAPGRCLGSAAGVTEKAFRNTEAATYWRIMFSWNIGRQVLVI